MQTDRDVGRGEGLARTGEALDGCFEVRLGVADGLLVEENEKRLSELNDVVRKGLADDDDFAEIANRVKRVFQST